MKTQNQQILNHLRNIGPITPLDALEHYGCFRLAARIHDLRSDGHEINMMRDESTDKRFATYTLIKEA